MKGYGAHVARQITPDDLPAVARVHLLAFPDGALTALGAEAVRRYYHWQLTGPHEVVALCIAQGGELTAFCFGGIFRGALRGFLRNNRRYLLYRVATRPWVLANGIVMRRVRLAIRLLGQTRSAPRGRLLTSSSRRRERMFGVLSIAVHPSESGAGQGTHLMDCLERAAQERGFPGMHLTVSVDNARAIGFYQRLGWISEEDASGVWSGAMRKNFVPMKTATGPNLGQL